MLLSKRGGERILEIADSGWRRCHTGFFDCVSGIRREFSRDFRTILRSLSARYSPI